MPGFGLRDTYRRYGLFIPAIAGACLLAMPFWAVAQDVAPHEQPSENVDVLVTPQHDGTIHVDEMRQEACSVIIDNFDEYPSALNWICIA